MFGGTEREQRAANHADSCSHRTWAWSLSPTRLSECGRCTSRRRIERTHEADMVTVGILDHGVAGAPECVVRGLTAGVTRSNEISVAIVDGLPR